MTDPNEAFNEQQPSDLDPSQSSNQASGIVTYHNQPSEISDDEYLNAEQRYAYDPAMSDQRKTQYRLALKELKLIIVDKVSMVGNVTLLHIDQ